MTAGPAAGHGQHSVLEHGVRLYAEITPSSRAEYFSHRRQTGKSGKISPEGGKILHEMKVGQTYESPSTPTSRT